MAIVAGLVGSFIGGLLISLLAGDGLDFKPSGIIGSLVGAVLVTAVWRWWDGRNKPTAADRAASRSGDPGNPTRADADGSVRQHMITTADIRMADGRTVHAYKTTCSRILGESWRSRPGIPGVLAARVA